MTSPLRILDTGLAGARRNVAVTAALGALHASGQIGDVLRFHRYPASVLLGQSQNAQKAVDAAFCASAGIEIARRLTGGGAVFMSPGMLAWDVLLDRRTVGGDAGSATALICKAVAAGLRELGAPAGFRAPADIEIAGRKVSGSAGWSAGRTVLLQGSLIIADDLAAMSRALMISEPELRSRVTSLAACGLSVLDHRQIANGICRALCAALSRDHHVDAMSDDELAECDLLEADVASGEYVFGGPSGPMTQ